MTIRYAIKENTLTDGRKVYRGMVLPRRTVSYDEFVDKVAASHTTVTKTDTVGVLSSAMEMLLRLLLDGYAVRMGMAIFRPSMRGTFENAEDLFDPRRHEVVVSVSATRDLQQVVQRNARVTKVTAPSPGPLPQWYEDHASGSTDSIITPREPGHVHGKRLRFDPADPTQGVFFVGSDRTATRATSIILNKPSHLILEVPALAPGTYHLEVRARPYRCPDLLTGHLDTALTVPEPLALSLGKGDEQRCEVSLLRTSPVPIPTYG